MKFSIIILATLFTSTAFADGLVCQSNDGVLSVKVYHQIYAAKGTRNSAVMIVSDNIV